MQYLILSIFIFFSLNVCSQEKKDSVNADTIPILSMRDLREITTSLQDLPAKDWLRICKAIDVVYFRKSQQMKADKQKKDPDARRKK